MQPVGRDELRSLAALELEGQLPYTVAYLRASRLNVSSAYQRQIDEAAVRRIVRTFNPQLLDVFKVSERDDGSYWVIDGHHRLEALKRSNRRNWAVACALFKGLSEPDEARLFAAQRNRKALTPRDLFRADLEAGDEAAVAISRIVHDLGLSLDLTMVHHKVGRSIQAIQAVRRVYLGGGADRLRAVLSIVDEAWGSDPAAFQGQPIMGVNAFFARYGNAIDRERLRQVLKRSPLTEIAGNALAFKRLHNDRNNSAFARAILAVYNKKLHKNQLPPWESVNRRGSNMRPVADDEESA